MKVVVKVFCCNTRIRVCIERHGWFHSYEIKLRNGQLPPGFENDPAIMAAYKQVQDAGRKWRDKQECRDSGGTIRG